MNQQKRQAIFERLRAKMPNPTTELAYDTVFELLIAVILSAQATDVSVNKATKKLFARANTPEAMLALGEDALKSYIKTIGLYNSKASNIIKTCECLLNEHGGQVPQSREQLEKLPGVGRKTANVVLNTAFNQPAIPVDTHVFRVANRTGIAKGNTPLAVEKKLLKVVGQAFIVNAHHWLVLHGRYVCLARKPDCPHCVLRDLCEYPNKTKT